MLFQTYYLIFSKEHKSNLFFTFLCFCTWMFTAWPRFKSLTVPFCSASAAYGLYGIITNGFRPNRTKTKWRLLGVHWMRTWCASYFDLAISVLILSTFFCFSRCSSGLSGVLGSMSKYRSGIRTLSGIDNCRNDDTKVLAYPSRQPLLNKCKIAGWCKKKLLPKCKSVLPCVL